MTTTRLPPKVIQGFSVRDYAYLWINGGCPLHQWCSGARGVDQGVVNHVHEIWYHVRTVGLWDGTAEPGDDDGLWQLMMYLQEHIGHPAEEYIPDEHTRCRA